MPFQIDDYRPFGAQDDHDPIQSANDAASITRGYCPVCQRRGFVFGPRGAAAINIECANVECRQRFNVVVGIRQDVVMCDRIDRITEWASEPAKEA